MYAIIRTGGKQAKVHEGDIIDVERLRAEDEVGFTPLLVVGDDGTVVSDRDVLKKSKVTAKVVGASAGPKLDIFKYKAKTGYRRRQGHRQKYTTIEVTKIEAPGLASKAKAAEGEEAAKPAAKAASKPSSSKTSKSSASKPASKSGGKSSKTTSKSGAKSSKTTSKSGSGSSKPASKPSKSSKSASKSKSSKDTEKES